jgi:2-keto-4-pentenoate hydratase
VNVERGMAAQLVRRREILAQGAEPIGWKIGFNVPEIQEKLGIDRPLTGFLTSDALLENGSSWSLGERGEVVVESEVAVELGDDARSIVALLPALELADPPDLSLELDQILAGDIFNRAVAFGPRVETTEPGDARILVNGEVEHEIEAAKAGARLDEMIGVVADRLGAADEELRAGDRIITGVLAPPHKAAHGDRVRLELDGIGAVELTFSD